MNIYRGYVVLVMLTLVACGGGGVSKPDPAPATTCAERLGTGSFVTTTVNNPSVTDSSCPSGQSLTQSGISYTTTTTTYSCPTPSSQSNPVASSTTSAPIVTQSKICTPVTTLTCAQKLGTGSFVDSSQVSTVTDSTCPAGQRIIQNGLSNITTTTTYSCVNPSSTDDPIESIISSAPVLTQPKMCNLEAPINYSTYFREKTGVTQANAAGFTGAGVKIAIYDNGFNVNNAALAGRVTTTFGDLTDDSTDNTSHGTSVAAIAAGRAWGDYPGGVAPNATLALADWDSNIYSIINWGAKVYNFSFGYGYDETNPSDSAPDANSASNTDVTRYVAPWVDEMRAIRDSGAFLAISAGNDGEQAGYDSVSILAGAPAFYTDLNNIVAVVAMSPLNGTKAVYSNPCGAIAMNFCLAAPGTVNLLLPTVTQADPLTVDSYRWFAGTSAAAPIVSGIAALVYQAFPGFNGNQVRQTLLTTATDIGELGVDPIYGWGYVNAQKAVLGPALVQTSFSAKVPANITWTFGNDIGGEGGIIKSGDGTLRMTGDNTYLSGTEIWEGQLQLSGSLGSDVWLNGGSFDAFGGRVAGDVFANAGVLNLAAGNTLDISGTLALNGAELRIIAPQTYTTSWQGSVLNAQAINGNAGTVSSSAWFNADVSIQSQQILADVSRKPVTEVLSAYSATQWNSAGNLEVAFQALDRGQGTTAFRQSAGILQQTDAVAAERALMVLSGQSQTTLKDVALETADALQPLLNERLHDTAQLPGDSGGLWFMFASPDGRKRADGFLATDVQSTVWAAGADRIFGNGRLGAAVFAADDRIDYQAVDDRIRGDRRGMAVYARHEGEVWYSQGFLSWARFDSDASRSIFFGEGSQLAQSRSQGSIRGMSLEMGRALNERFSLAVLANADWVDIDAYQESGSSGLELGFTGNSVSRYVLGPELRFNSGAKAGWQWNAVLGYRQVLNSVDTGMRGYYTGLPGELFTVDGMPYPDGFMHWALGMGYRSTNAYWYLRANGQHSDNSDSHALSTGVRIGF